MEESFYIVKGGKKFDEIVDLLDMKNQEAFPYIFKVYEAQNPSCSTQKWEMERVHLWWVWMNRCVCNSHYTWGVYICSYKHIGAYMCVCIHLLFLTSAVEI